MSLKTYTEKIKKKKIGISCLNKSLTEMILRGKNNTIEYDFCAHREYLANNAAQLSQFEIISVNWLLCYGFLFDFWSDPDPLSRKRILGSGSASKSNGSETLICSVADPYKYHDMDPDSRFCIVK